MADDSEDLEKFLKNVDEVGSLIKNLSSHDREEREKAIKDSDDLLQKKQDHSNCTKINKTDIKDHEHKVKDEQCQEQFLKSIELDANERASRRKNNEADANSFKANGNVAFKAGRFEEAIKFYTEALHIVKYFPTLYTNRAQAYINVKNYDSAIDDCKWAIRVDKTCIKAYVHCGRALQQQSLFSEAVSYFKMAEEIDPKQKDVIKEYISSVEHDQRKAEIERKAVVELDNGDVQLQSLFEAIQLLMEENKQLKERINLAENLKQIVENNQTGKTLFRVKHGFECFSEHSYFKRLCLMENKWESPEQGYFVNKMLDLAKASVENDDYNLDELLDHGAIKTMHKLFMNCHNEKVILSGMLLLHQISESCQGRKHILQYILDESCFIDDLLGLAKEVNPISKVVMGCLNNLSLENRFSLQFSKKLENISISIIDRFVSRPVNRSETILILIVASSLSTIANLARVKNVRNRLQLNQQIWEFSSKVLAQCVLGSVNDCSDENLKKIIYAQLGLLLNLLSETSDYAKKYSVSITPLLHKLLKLPDSINVLQRTIGVLRLLMTYSSDTINLVCDEESYKLILELVKKSSDDLTVSYGVKCLALCTINNDIARTYVLEYGLIILYPLLKSKSEVTVGNCALILGSCFEQKGACERFIGTEIVKELLSIASNKIFPEDVNHNAAIALAKLVKNDLRYLEELRKLHGLEILHSVVKSTSS